MTAPTFLVSSAGRRGELIAILRDVVDTRGGDGAVLTADMSQLVPAAYLGDRHLLVPPCTAAGFVDAMLELCERHGVSDLVPTIDTELPVYAGARDRFVDVGVRVWVSSPEAVEICLDKRRTHHHLSNVGIPVPRQWGPHELDDIPQSAYPLILKPSRGSASVGVRRIEARADGAGVVGEDDVLEQLATGDEHTIDVLVDRAGRVRGSVIRRRLETRAGEVSKGITVDDPRLHRLAAAAVASLPGAYGVLNVQVFADAAGGPAVVTEINARVGGGFPLAWAAGSRMPLWLVQESAGEDPTAELSAQPGVVMLRYDSSVFLTDDVGELGLGRPAGVGEPLSRFAISPSEVVARLR